MSLQNVQLFYERLATDGQFRAQWQTAKSKEECRQKVQEAGYDFTQAEFEIYTRQLLESDALEKIQDLNEQELEIVIGGISSSFRQTFVPPYGVVWPNYR